MSSEAASPPLADRDWIFPLGQDSYGDPRKSAGTYVRGWNVVCRGGVIQTRYGTRVMAVLPRGNPQCLTEFAPLRGHRQLIAVVAGRVYTLEHPYTRWRVLPNIRLSPRAEVVYHALAEQVVERAADGSLRYLQSPRRVLVLQDQLSPAAWYDGYDHGNDRDVDGIPMGGPMLWDGLRLWVARGAQLYGSDTLNPRAFIERFYLGEADSLIYPTQITALGRSNNAALGQSFMVVWTRTETYLVATTVPRAQWAITPGFSRTLFRIGCVSQRSVIEHGGKLWWMTVEGMTSLDEAAQSQVSAATPVIDRAMSWSREHVDQREQLAAGAVGKGFLLMSVGHASQTNTHTWCYDAAATHELNGGPTAAWASVWTGFQPVEWCTVNQNGEERVFALCTSDSGDNYVLEAMLADRKDTGQDIECAVELRTLGGPDPRAKRLRFAELLLSEIRGELEVAVSYRGLARGRYQRLLKQTAKAAVGRLRSGETLSASSALYAYGPQMRRWQTEEPREHGKDPLGGSNAQLGLSDGIDFGFSFLIQWCGRAALREFGVSLSAHTERTAGKPAFAEESEETVVRWDGSCGSAGALDASDFAVFEQQAGASADWRDDLDVIAVRRSLLSDTAALRMARQAATAQMDYWRERDAPPILGGTKS